nr:hypothetical protein [Salinicola halimionae]
MNDQGGVVLRQALPVLVRFQVHLDRSRYRSLFAELLGAAGSVRTNCLANLMRI